jgi:ring-1,2-phenylacetyl-CoA epoxidase subunit PaaE
MLLTPAKEEFAAAVAQVTSGTAEMAKNSILTDGEIASGLVLTASASYVRDNICGL